MTSVVGGGAGNGITGVTELTPVDTRGPSQPVSSTLSAQVLNEGSRKPFSFIGTQPLESHSLETPHPQHHSGQEPLDVLFSTILAETPRHFSRPTPEIPYKNQHSSSRIRRYQVQGAGFSLHKAEKKGDDRKAETSPKLLYKSCGLRGPSAPRSLLP